MQRPIGRLRPALPFTTRSALGFTLVELMITIAVAAILLAIATPSFTSLINSSRLTGAANEMVAVLQGARMEAVRRNSTISVCVDCNGDDSLIAYVDANNDDAFSAGEEIVRQSTVHAAVQITAGPNIAFRADGLGRASDGSLANGAYRFCLATTSPEENVRLVNIGSGSRISTEPDSGGGTC